VPVLNKTQQPVDASSVVAYLIRKHRIRPNDQYSLSRVFRLLELAQNYTQLRSKKSLFSGDNTAISKILMEYSQRKRSLDLNPKLPVLTQAVLDAVWDTYGNYPPSMLQEFTYMQQAKLGTEKQVMARQR